MEKKGRSLGSGNEFRKKKTGIALPLGVFLSFNDRDVHPLCPDASNPYHKCGQHCLHKIPSAKDFFHAVTSEGGNVKMSEGRGVNPNCPNASNPFHKCAEYCLERLSEKRRDTGKGPAMKPKEEKKAVVIADRGVNSECKNASNPYHVCAEYCFQNVLERNRPGQVRKLKSRKQLRKIVSNIEITSMRSECKYASNPYHECDEFCLRNEPDRNKSKGEKKSKVVSFKRDTSSAHPHHEHASRPYDEDAEIFIKNTSEKEHCEGENRTVVTTERREFSDCKNASNLHHVCSEYCFQALPEKFQCGEAIVKAKEDRKVSVPIERTVNPVCRNALNPYHVCAEYCFQNTGSHQPGRAIMKSNEDKGVAIPLKRGLNQVCKNASNPYHVCAEYCFQNVPERHRPVRALKSKEEKEVVAEPQRGVNPDCKNASNPYHVCAEYCFQNAPEREQRGKAMKLRSQKQLNKTASNIEMRSVHPRCRYASNPYHECAEYCFQKNVPSRQIPEAVMKPDEREKESSHALRRDVVSKCKNTSSPFHRSSEYCSEGNREKNQAVEDIPVMIKEKKRNSPKKETRNHPMMENSSMDSEYVEASKSSNNYAESSGEIIILQDGMEKISMDSKDVEELSPNSNDTEFCEGITVQDGTKGLHSVVEVVEMKNRKEPTGVQPLSIDASDLFQEWAKYCFQEKFAEGIIVIQDNRVERRAVTTTNDKGNVVLNYESSNLEKVQAKGSSPRSLPASVLFFVGFLFSMLYWTQVIHSLVMSSEKNKGRQRLTSKRHDVDAKCSNVSDPYHKCS